MLKTQITGAKYLSPQTNQMTNLNIAVPADSKDTEFGTSDILLAKDVIAYLDAKDNKSDVLLKKSDSGGYYIEENSNKLGEKAFAANSSCTASSEYSHAEGYRTTASGAISHAEGGDTIASSFMSHAEGDSATASGACSHAECKNTTASGNYSHAEGDSTTASGDCSHAEGDRTTANGNTSHAEGAYTTASGYYSHAEGGLTTASGFFSHAEGFNTTASGFFSHAEGTHNVENIHAIHSVGIGTDSASKNAEYIYIGTDELTGIDDSDPKNGYKYLIGVGGYNGISTDNNTYKSVLEVISDLNTDMSYAYKLNATDYITWLNPNLRLMTGYSSVYGMKLLFPSTTSFIDLSPSGIYHCLYYQPNNVYTNSYDGLYKEFAYYSNGDDLKADMYLAKPHYSKCLFSMRSGVNISSANTPITDDTTVDIQLNDYRKNTGITINTEGIKLKNGSATNVYATDGSIVDLSTKANASDVLLKKSASGGYYIEANSNQLGLGAFAANSKCTASGTFAHAEGSATASGMGSHAEGNATASGKFSHAEGTSNAGGEYSHAEGSLAEAIGEASHAEGNNTKASGAYSHAEGVSTYASGYCSHALGINNVDDKNAIYSVGIGSSTTRKNAEYIYAKNNEHGYGLTDDPKNGYKYLIGIGGYDGISTDNTTYKSVQEVIADLTARIEQLETKVRALEAANTPA